MKETTETSSNPFIQTQDDQTSHSSATVIVARHGERLDYVLRDEGKNWVQQQKQDPNGRPWDPPLTVQGQEQGRRLGRHLKVEVARRGLPPISAVYASPFLRCRQTARAAWRAINDVDEVNDDPTDATVGGRVIPPVRIEYGLGESVNESWYRSWALPGSDGTWGCEGCIIDDTQLHPSSKRPVQSVLCDWKSNEASPEDYDLSYESTTQIDRPYSFVPQNLETRKDQSSRMRAAVQKLATPAGTVLVVSHGGPVIHLYESVTQNNWETHGECTYCCYSLYQLHRVAHDLDLQWDALCVNESSYLHELLSASKSSDNFHL